MVRPPKPSGSAPFPGVATRANLSCMPQPWSRSDNDDDALLPGPPASPSSKQYDDRPPEPLEDAHRAAVHEGLDQMRRGALASDGEIAAVYRRAGL